MTCNLGTLAAGAQATVKITAGSQWIKPVSNTAAVGGNEPDPNLANNIATQQTVILDSHVIEGYVADAKGKPVNGVTVTLSGPRNASMTIANGGGSYFFHYLPVGGNYTVTP